MAVWIEWSIRGQQAHAEIWCNRAAKSGLRGKSTDVDNIGKGVVKCSWPASQTGIPQVKARVGSDKAVTSSEGSYDVRTGTAPLPSPQKSSMWTTCRLTHVLVQLDHEYGSNNPILGDCSEQIWYHRHLDTVRLRRSVKIPVIFAFWSHWCYLGGKTLIVKADCLSWMDLETIIPSEVSQKEKNKSGILTQYMWNLKKTGMDDLIYKAEIKTQM